MSANQERLIADAAAKLPSFHPDREFMANQAELFHIFNLKNEASMTPRQLVLREGYAWEEFFGQKITIPNVPHELIETRSRILEVGWKNFAAHFLPDLKWKKKDKFPGWADKPDDEFWAVAKNGGDQRRTNGIWVLWDTTKRQHYASGMQGYDADQLYPVVARFREQQTIGSFRLGDKMVPDGSRFAIRHDEIYEKIFPEIARILKLDTEQIRLPKFIENNVLYNRVYSELGEETTFEWFHDRIEGSKRLVGCGSSSRLASLSNRNSNFGFRPMIVFPK